MEGGRSKIIMVDDNMAILAMGKNMLKSFYEVYPAPSAAKLFEILENVLPDLILLDIEMPGVNGFETIEKLKADQRYADIPVIFLTAESDGSSELEGLRLGAVDYVSKPFLAPLLLKRISNHLLIIQQKNDLLVSQAKLKDYADNLEIKVSEKAKEVINMQNAVLATVAELVEFRDELTGGHITRTQLYLKALVSELLVEGTYAEEIGNWNMDFFLLSAQLHDVGKIAISDFILTKPERLTIDEFEVMKSHVSVGVKVIKKIMHNAEDSAFLHHALLIASAHHEKWDGTGYPAGLKGADIPLEGRLMAIADVYDALIGDRPYKKALTHEEACEFIEKGAETRFDPVLVEAFKKVEDEFKRISMDYAGTSEPILNFV